MDLRKTLFCNISWMKEYKGITRDDKPFSGAGYVVETGDAYEKYNFLPFDDGYQYGFIETKHQSGTTDFENDYKKFNLENFGDEFKGQDIADGILVIFFARNPLDSKFYIVGYYKDAEVYKIRQRAYNNTVEENIQYNLKCKQEDAVLVPINQRIPLNLPPETQLFYRQLFFYPVSSKYPELCEKIVENLEKYDQTRDAQYLQYVHQAWIVPCNPNYYDIDKALTELPEGLWYGQNIKNISAGDYVFIYVGRPVQAYKYKCIVLNASVSGDKIDKDEDKQYVKGQSILGESAAYMRIKLINLVDAPIKDVFDNVPNVSVAPMNQVQLKGAYLEYLESRVIENEDKPSIADLDDELSNTCIYYGDVSNTPKEPVTKDGVKFFPRNENVKQIALMNSENRCAISSCQHPLFISKKGKPYLEVHHIIPINAQEYFPNNNLDIPENVICLCPSCHREVHNGKDREQKIVELYSLRKEALAEKGINIDIDKLLEFYK